MVKRYSPTPFQNYSDSLSNNDPGYADVDMRESPIGAWVKIETYQDETARLKKQVARQKKIVEELQSKIADMHDYKDRSPLK